jgi:hypothetical protein
VSTSKTANAHANSSGFRKKLHATHPSDIAVKVIRDNEPMHVSEKTKKWLAPRTEGRFKLRLRARARPLVQSGQRLLLEDGAPKLALHRNGFASEPEQGLWHTWTISTVCPSFTPNPTGSRCRGGRGRSKETLYQAGR